MFEFAKLCKAYEKMNALERGAVLTESSVKVLARLAALDIPGVHPVEALAGFMLGAVCADGKVTEEEYLLIYPALCRVFGEDFDFESVKESFRKDKEGRTALADYTQQLMKVFAVLDEDLQQDVLTLCLCVLSLDGKITVREKNYLRRLCRA